MRSLPLRTGPLTETASAVVGVAPSYTAPGAKMTNGKPFWRAVAIESVFESPICKAPDATADATAAPLASVWISTVKPAFLKKPMS